MLADEESNPLVWLSKNGIDIKAALDDPEVMQRVTEAFDGWTQKQADGEAAEQAQGEAIDASLQALAGVQQEFGLSDEQMDRLWTHFWDEVFAPAFKGEVSKDTWVALMHAMNYDQDIAKELLLNKSCKRVCCFTYFSYLCRKNEKVWQVMK